MAASQPGPGLNVATAGTTPMDGLLAGGAVNPPSTHQLHSSFTTAAGALTGRSAARRSVHATAVAITEALASNTRLRAFDASGSLMETVLLHPWRWKNPGRR